MAQITAAIRHPRDCAGCAGSGSCWVCLGHGRLRNRLERDIDCHRCNGTGRCGEWGAHLVDLPAQPHSA